MGDYFSLLVSSSNGRQPGMLTGFVNLEQLQSEV